MTDYISDPGILAFGKSISESPTAHVFHAKTTTDNPTSVAVKRISKHLPASVLLRASRECLILPRYSATDAKNSHPNLVSLRGSFQDARFLYILTEFCPLGDLEYLMRTGTVCNVLCSTCLSDSDHFCIECQSTCEKAENLFSLRQIQLIIAELTQVLQFLHYHLRVVHCDICPRNILVVENEDKSSPYFHVKVADLGSSFLLEEENNGALFTGGDSHHLQLQATALISSFSKASTDESTSEIQLPSIENENPQQPGYTHNLSPSCSWKYALQEYGLASTSPLDHSSIETINTNHGYAAPEIVAGSLANGEITRSVDLWSLGALLEKLLQLGEESYKNRNFEDSTAWICGKDLVNCLKIHDSKGRLGFTDRNYGSIMNHPFFSNFDWSLTSKGFQ